MVESWALLALLALTQGAQDGEDRADPEGPMSPEPSVLDYQIAQVRREDVASGRTRVSVETGAPAARYGTYPVRFIIDNTSGPRQVITLSIRFLGLGQTTSITRAVQVEAGERRGVNMPVPSQMRYGTAQAKGPGISENTGAGVSSVHLGSDERVVLSLSSPQEIEKYIGRAPRYSGAKVQVHVIPPEEAPTELASYLGYDAVMVPEGAKLESLDDAQKNALEAFVATGGHLLVGGALRSLNTFPLLSSIRPGVSNYGFGKLFFLAHPGAKPGLFREGLSVSPQGSVQGIEADDSYRRYNSIQTSRALLPQANAPLGRFLFIITLFTLAIGPGSVWVARRRSPAALLVTIPATAFITCGLILGYSLIADGFVVHSSSYSFTLLDRQQRRAITQGVTAYYANLAPSKVTFGPSTMVLGPPGENSDWGLDAMSWQDGLTLGSDFIPSRVYREWGLVSAEPSRARVAIKKKGAQWVAQNALGAPIESLVVNVEGRLLSCGPIRDGGEEPLEPGAAESYSGNPGSDRFSDEVPQLVARRELRPQEFLARISGAGLMPTGGISTQAYAGEHWVRGEFEP